jgi:glycosyltransferase involved in cell wall biosynthesis
MDQAVPGGAENGIIRRITQLDRSRFEIKVCFLLADNPYQDAFRKMDIPVCSMMMKHNKQISGLIKLFLYLKSEKPDLLHTHFTNSDFYGIIVGKILKIPNIVSTFHMMRDWRKNRRLRDKIRHWFTIPALKMFDRILTVSDSVRNSAIQFNGLNSEKVITIYNGIDIKKYKPLEKSLINNEFKKTDDVKIIGTIGRLCLEKGQEFLINAMPMIKKHFPDTKLIIVGEGELRDLLEELVDKLNLNNSVFLPGFRDDIPLILNSFDIFVLPSLTEGMPNSLIEAMACALPCIVSNIPSCSELIEEGINGLLVEKENSTMIADNVNYLLQNSEIAKKMGIAARKKIQNTYNIESTAKNLEFVYDDLIQHSTKKTTAPIKN